MTYAENTSVSVEKTRAEIDALLAKHGARQRIGGVDDEGGFAIVGFTLAGRQIRLHIPLPKIEDFPRKGEQPRGWLGWQHARREEYRRKAYEQACRSRWRAALLLVRAKLEAIALGFSTVEREFLADIALPDGSTVYRALEHHLAEAYETGRVPPLLGMGEPGASGGV